MTWHEIGCLSAHKIGKRLTPPIFKEQTPLNRRNMMLLTKIYLIIPATSVASENWFTSTSQSDQTDISYNNEKYEWYEI